MSNFHPLDLAVVALYLGAIFYFARRGAKRTDATQEGFFLAGRKLGKVYQFLLNFGNSTDANGAVSTASLVYQQGVSGVWLGFQVIFLNPYYWFMNLWFRRVRLMTVADLFEDRLDSRGLARFYAIFQIITAVVITIGFGNLISYKIASSLMVKPETAWTPAERDSVARYQEMKQLETQAKAAAPLALAPALKTRLGVLHEANARGELHSTITAISAWWFYLGYTLIVGGYVVVGGLTATAMNEMLQGLLTVVFSAMLIPLGFAALGGAGVLAERVPEAMFELIKSGGTAQQVTGIVLLGILANTLVQMNGIPGNMTISGSARDEYAARFGAVSGTFAKRLMIIMWAFCGLIAVSPRL